MGLLKWWTICAIAGVPAGQSTTSGPNFY